MAVHLVIDQSNKVVNRIEWDGEAEHMLPDGLTAVLGDGDIGWTWNGTEAVDPNPPDPAAPVAAGVTVSD